MGLGFGEEVVEGFELPFFLEVFAGEALAEFVDEGFGLLVSHGVLLLSGGAYLSTIAVFLAYPVRRRPGQEGWASPLLQELA